MKQELQAVLKSRYPKIFDLAINGGTKEYPYRGIDCNDAWFHLIDLLCEGLQWETDKHEAPQAVVVYIKEKLGGMRFQVQLSSPLSERQHWMINDAVAMSERICPECGVLGEKTWPLARACEHV